MPAHCNSKWLILKHTQFQQNFKKHFLSPQCMKTCTIRNFRIAQRRCQQDTCIWIKQGNTAHNLSGKNSKLALSQISTREIELWMNTRKWSVSVTGGKIKAHVFRATQFSNQRNHNTPEFLPRWVCILSQVSFVFLTRAAYFCGKPKVLFWCPNDVQQIRCEANNRGFDFGLFKNKVPLIGLNVFFYYFLFGVLCFLSPFWPPKDPRPALWQNLRIWSSDHAHHPTCSAFGLFRFLRYSNSKSSFYLRNGKKDLEILNIYLKESAGKNQVRIRRDCGSNSRGKFASAPPTKFEVFSRGHNSCN